VPLARETDTIIIDLRSAPTPDQLASLEQGHHSRVLDLAVERRATSPASDARLLPDLAADPDRRHRDSLRLCLGQRTFSAGCCHGPAKQRAHGQIRFAALDSDLVARLPAVSQSNFRQFCPLQNGFQQIGRRGRRISVRDRRRRLLF
jgi:hypothetical protein